MLSYHLLALNFSLLQNFIKLSPANRPHFFRIVVQNLSAFIEIIINDFSMMICFKDYADKILYLSEFVCNGCFYWLCLLFSDIFVIGHSIVLKFTIVENNISIPTKKLSIGHSIYIWYLEAFIRQKLLKIFIMLHKLTLKESVQPIFQFFSSFVKENCVYR